MLNLASRFPALIRRCPLEIHQSISNYASYQQYLNKSRYSEIFQLKTRLSSIKFWQIRMSSESRKPNRLSLEKSPYLLQHAMNPVDWYPWGEEAFDKAKQENKLIFLSVGYSTCHWCHVMEKESFENEEVAEIMNEFFVNIKVDREERLDVDKLFMEFVQASTGAGGWPMSVFLTPDLHPLTGGTYFPPEDRYGRPGFKSVLRTIAQQWCNKQEMMKTTGKQCMEVLSKLSSNDRPRTKIDVPNEDVWQKCLLQLSNSYDNIHGGFTIAPKFPQPCNFNFLLHWYANNKKKESGSRCLDMCLNTLKRMAYGGIHDHVNCGFARYSVDKRWHVPHFEKMLYDQAQLTISYTDAYVLTKDDFFADIVRDILLYVMRDLSHSEGGFYGAQDADSYPYHGAEAKQEGAFCVWDFEEISDLLGDDFDLFAYHFNVKECGNVAREHDVHNELENKNVLACFASYEDTARKMGRSLEETRDVLKKCLQILYEYRQKRPKPQIDTKIVTSWNGLMISGLAKAGFVLKDESYIERAIAAANFIKTHLYNEESKTLIRCCYGEDDVVTQLGCPIDGFLDDYVYLIKGLLDLYEASLDVNWLMWAESLQEQQDRLFWDTKGFGYFSSSNLNSNVILRGKEDQDGAEPCGNSMAVHNLIRLAAYLDRQDLKDKAGKTLTAFSERLKGIPVALPEMVSALMFYHTSPTQVFIAGEREDIGTEALLDVVRSKFIPGRILAIVDGPGGRSGLLYQRLESMSRLKRVNGKSAAYVCRNFTCSLPVTEPEDLSEFFDTNTVKTESS